MKKGYYITDKKLYSVYYNMLDRCSNPKNKKYHRYGGRGINVCDEWKNSFTSFMEWAKSNGFEPSLKLDRSKNSEGYSPSNCRWVTNKVNCNNTDFNRIITYKGETKTLAVWCDQLQLKYNTVSNRILSGWSIEDAFNNSEDNERKYKWRGQQRNAEKKVELAKILNSEYSFFQLEPA